MKKVLNICLLLLFIVTLLVPLTGIAVHKMAAALFLILCIRHCLPQKAQRQKMFYAVGYFYCFYKRFVWNDF